VPLTNADPNRSIPTFACVVLAAGAGSRYGAPKALALLPDGSTFLAAVVRTARECGADPIVAVVRPGEVRTSEFAVAENPDPSSEQIASVRLGLARLANTDVDGALIWPVDCPFVRADTIEAIVDAAVADRAQIIVPCFGGRSGHPTWFGRETWPELMVAAADGAREVVRRDPTRVQRVEVNDPSVLTDIDTRADLTCALAGEQDA
jgi:molybdenum cofactor cytidylyltransferase